MVEPTKERMEWENKDVGIMTIEREIEIKNDKGKIIGTKKEVTTARASYTDIVKGLEVVKERLKKNEEKLEKKMKEVEKMGKIPTMTPALNILRKQLMDLARIENYEKYKRDIDDLKSEIKEDQEFVANRMALLNTRPEK